MFKSQERKAEIKENDELIDALIKYILPLFSKRFVRKKHSRLEDIVQKEKTETKGMRSLDEFIRFLLDGKGFKSKPNFLLFTGNKENSDMAHEIVYNISLHRRKKERNEQGYSIEIKYEENEKEEKLDIKIKVDDYTLPNMPSPSKNYLPTKEKKISGNPREYSFSVSRESKNKIKNNYSVSISYANDYEEERLSVNYKSTVDAYFDRRQQALHDFSDRVPGKHVNLFPESIMGGVLGFTYLGENFMGLRDDLSGRMKKMVDIHESIHTPNEYETRILTDWIMSKERPKYIK